MLPTLSQIKELLKINRTYRIFDQEKPIDASVLVELVELCRYTASGRNAQPLKYAIVSEPSLCDQIFPSLAWAGYFKDWSGPAPGQRPVAYLVQCLDTRYGSDCLCDDGLQLEAITLGARSLGIGSCIIKAFNALEVSRVLNLPQEFKPRYVLALGYPNQEVHIEDMNGEVDADFKYYRTEDGVHHVPKRCIDELVINPSKLGD